MKFSYQKISSLLNNCSTLILMYVKTQSSSNECQNFKGVTTIRNPTDKSIMPYKSKTKNIYVRHIMRRHVSFVFTVFKIKKTGKNV